jgi:hypothetical protein
MRTFPFGSRRGRPRRRFRGTVSPARAAPTSPRARSRRRPSPRPGRARAIRLAVATRMPMDRDPHSRGGILNLLRTSGLAALALALAVPTVSSAKRKPPAPPPDLASGCTFVAQASVPDYLVLASISIGVRCATPKQSISVSAQLTMDGVLLSPVLPHGSESPPARMRPSASLPTTCSLSTACRSPRSATRSTAGPARGSSAARSWGRLRPARRTPGSDGRLGSPKPSGQAYSHTGASDDRLVRARA